MKKVALYLRCSTEKQDYEYQESILRSKLSADSTIIEVYKEKISGFKSESERPEMNRLLNDVKQRKYNCVYATEFTRVSRSTLNLLSIIKELDNNEVNLYISKDGLNTLNDDGTKNKMTSIILTVLSQFGEIEAEATKFRTKAGKKEAVKDKHQYIGGILPLGYSYDDDKKLIINEKEKEIVLRIFNDYVIKNKTLNTIANEFNIEKIETKCQRINRGKNNKNYTWSTSQINAILGCQWYTGQRDYKGEKITLPNSLIFNELLEFHNGDSIYNGAEIKLKENAKRHKANKYIYILNNLYCSCGETMTGDKISDETNIYTCLNTKRRMQNKNIQCSTGGKRIVVDIADNVIWTLIKNKIAEFKMEIEEKSNKEKEGKIRINELNNNIISIKKIISDKDKLKKNTISNFTKLGYSLEDIKDEISKIDKELNIQNKIINEYKTEIETINFTISNFNLSEEITNNISKIENNRYLLKEYLSKLIKKITFFHLDKTKQYDSIFEIEFNNGINRNKKYIIYFNSYVRKPNKIKIYYSTTAGTDLHFDDITKKIILTKDTIQSKITSKTNIEYSNDEVKTIMQEKGFNMEELKDLYNIKTGLTGTLILKEYNIEEFKELCNRGNDSGQFGNLYVDNVLSIKNQLITD